MINEFLYFVTEVVFPYIITQGKKIIYFNRTAKITFVMTNGSAEIMNSQFHIIIIMNLDHQFATQYFWIGIMQIFAILQNFTMWFWLIILNQSVQINYCIHIITMFEPTFILFLSINNKLCGLLRIACTRKKGYIHYHFV
jgi:hypothetical protein